MKGKIMTPWLGPLAVANREAVRRGEAPVRMICTCHYPEKYRRDCPIHELVWIPNGQWNPMISAKSDVEWQDPPENCRARVKVYEHCVGDLVRVDLMGDRRLYGVNAFYPHALRSGTVEELRDGGRLVMVRFGDGTLAGFYHNELTTLQRKAARELRARLETETAGALIAMAAAQRAIEEMGQRAADAVASVQEMRARYYDDGNQ